MLETNSLNIADLVQARSEAEELSIKTAGLESQLREVERKHKAELIRTRNEVQEAMEKELLSLEDTIIVYG